MWVFSIYGFYSIASAAKTDGTPDPNMVMVRSRCKHHLQNLQKRCPELAGSKLLSPPTRDCGYRLIVPKSVWVRPLQERAEEQTWAACQWIERTERASLTDMFEKCPLKNSIIARHRKNLPKRFGAATQNAAASE